MATNNNNSTLTQAQRVAAESKRIQEEIAASRKAQAQALVGTSTDAKNRRGHYKESLHQWAEKGQHTDVPADVKESIPPQALTQRKQEYAQNLQRFQDKGREHLIAEQKDEEERGALPVDLQERFGGSGSKPSLFAYDPFNTRPTEPTAAAKPASPTTTNKNAQAAMEKLRPKGWDGVTYYSLVDLRQRRVSGIDMKNREQYLSPEEFQKTFGMTKEEFALCPKWKRDKLKSAICLF